MNMFHSRNTTQEQAQQIEFTLMLYEMRSIHDAFRYKANVVMPLAYARALHLLEAMSRIDCERAKEAFYPVAREYDRLAGRRGDLPSRKTITAADAPQEIFGVWQGTAYLPA